MQCFAVIDRFFIFRLLVTEREVGDTWLFVNCDYNSKNYASLDTLLGNSSHLVSN